MTPACLFFHALPEPRQNAKAHCWSIPTTQIPPPAQSRAPSKCRWRSVVSATMRISPRLRATAAQCGARAFSSRSRDRKRSTSRCPANSPSRHSRRRGQQQPRGGNRLGKGESVERRSLLVRLKLLSTLERHVLTLIRQDYEFLPFCVTELACPIYGLFRPLCPAECHRRGAVSD